MRIRYDITTLDLFLCIFQLVSRLSKENINDGGGVDFCRSAIRGWGEGKGRKTAKGEREGERPFSLSLSNPSPSSPSFPTPFDAWETTPIPLS